MELKQAIKSRYSERYFKREKPSREKIELLIEAAIEAPNSCNLQTIKYLIIDDEVLNKRLAGITTTKMNWAPVNIVVFANPEVTVKHSSGTVSLGASMQNILLTATDLGLATCPMAGFSNDKETKKILGIPDKYDLYLIIGVGYSDRGQTKRERIPVKEIISWNEYNDSSMELNLSPNSDRWSVSQLIDYRRRIAPVYRYEGRFSLGVYNPESYDVLLTNTEAFFISDEIKNVLDIDSYDGIFVSHMMNRFKNKIFSISSHLDYILDLVNDFPLDIKDSLKIDKENKIQESDKFDLVTCVNKLQFCPNHSSLIKNSCEKLKEGGYILFVVDSQGRFTWFIKSFVLKLRAWMSQTSFNVYESNPYYKMGPYNVVTINEIKKCVSDTDLSVVDCGRIKSSDLAKSNHLNYVIFRKNR